MPEQWRGANDFYYVPKKSDEEKAQPVEIEDEQPTAEDDGPEVRLSEGTFLPGNGGYQFNNKCKARVKVEYLKETNRKKVLIKLFTIYNGEEENLQHQVEGYEKDGYAEAEVTLFYGDAYGEALQNDSSAICEYKFKASHSKGEKEIESELLEMPNSQEAKLTIHLEIDPNNPAVQDDTFTLKSADNDHFYSKTMTVKDDKISGDTSIDLEFDGLDQNMSYTLEIDPGKEGDPYTLFENIPFMELKDD